MRRRKRVLFLCAGNSARSQMAEALVNHFLSPNWEANSAGTRPASSVHPLAVEAMAELGIDISSQKPKPADQFRGERFEAAATVCDDAAQNCPLWLGSGHLLPMGFLGPVPSPGSQAEQLDVFRRVRDDIQEKVLPHLRQIDNSSSKENSNDS